MGILSRNELRRLEKAAREKDKRHLADWASQYDNQIRMEYEKAYNEEISYSINVFLTAVAYTAHFSEETKLGKRKLSSFMEDLFVTIDMFRTGEYKPEEYKEELQKNGIYQDMYDYSARTRRIVTICGPSNLEDLIHKKEKELTLKGYMVFTSNVYDYSNLSDEEKEELIEIHKNKIRISDEVYIINKDNKIGEYTQKEIDYARSLKKLITYMEDYKYGEED